MSEEIKDVVTMCDCETCVDISRRAMAIANRLMAQLEEWGADPGDRATMMALAAVTAQTICGDGLAKAQDTMQLITAICGFAGLEARGMMIPKPVDATKH